jgi:hypothetical protein
VLVDVVENDCGVPWIFRIIVIGWRTHETYVLQLRSFLPQDHRIVLLAKLHSRPAFFSPENCIASSSSPLTRASVANGQWRQARAPHDPKYCMCTLCVLSTIVCDTSAHA